MIIRNNLSRQEEKWIFLNTPDIITQTSRVLYLPRYRNFEKLNGLINLQMRASNSQYFIPRHFFLYKEWCFFNCFWVLQIIYTSFWFIDELAYQQYLKSFKLTHIIVLYNDSVSYNLLLYFYSYERLLILIEMFWSDICNKKKKIYFVDLLSAF